MSIETEIKKLTMAVTQLTDFLVANHSSQVAHTVTQKTAPTASSHVSLQTFPGDNAANAQMTAALEGTQVEQVSNNTPTSYVPAQTTTAVSPEMVNQALVEASGRCNDQGAKVRDLMAAYGAHTVQQIPVEKYGEVIQRAATLA